MITATKDLVRPAEKAGIKVPTKLYDYNADDFPHFYLYTAMQLNSPLPNKAAHWQNAELIAGLTDDQANSLTWNQLLDMGYQIGFPKVVNKRD